MISLGQRLNLPKLQWYIDYYGAVDELDRLRIASAELAPLTNNEHGVFFGNVHYNSFVTEPIGSLHLDATSNFEAATKPQASHNTRL